MASNIGGSKEVEDVIPNVRFLVTVAIADNGWILSVLPWKGLWGGDERLRDLTLAIEPLFGYMDLDCPHIRLNLRSCRRGRGR